MKYEEFIKLKESDRDIEYKILEMLWEIYNKLSWIDKNTSNKK